MLMRILFSAAVISGLLLGVQLTMCAPAYGQIRFDTSTAVPKTDPIYPVLAEHKALIEMRSEGCKSAQPTFSDWVWVNSPAAAQLFPKLQFASMSFSAACAHGLEVTVAIDTATKCLVKELYCYGSYEAYGELLVDHRVPLRDAADAKLVWDAFCDIHHRHWKDLPLKKVSASEWHLGISQYDQTTSVVGEFKTVVTQTHYKKVLVDPRTGQITSWESKGDSSDERKIPTSIQETPSGVGYP
jgi:hypothetical protein